MSDNPLQAFVERFGPAAGELGPQRFVREVLGAKPDEWQDVVLAAYGRGERGISIASCHGPGKTACAAWIILCQILTRYPQKTAVTAPTSNQLWDALYAETKMWAGKLPAPLQALLDIKGDRIELKAAPESSFVSYRTARAEQPEAMQGVHSEWVLLVGDEASGIPEPIFEAAVGSMSGHRATTLLLSNPVRTSGFFFDTQHKLKDRWVTVQVSGVERAGAYYSPRVSTEFVEHVKALYGEDSNAYRVRVLGLFPRADLDTIIPYELVESAVGRDVAPSPTAVEVWGLDVARFGDDRTALCKRRGNVVTEPVRTWHELDLMQVVGVVKAEWDACQPSRRPVDICVDAIGLGAGVADRLRELGLPTRAVNVSETPATRGERFVNLRTQLWWDAREWFTQRTCAIPMEKREDEQRVSLRRELVQLKYKIVDSSGKLRAESKADMKKRGLHSPDAADAFVLTFASPAATMLGAGGGMRTWQNPLHRGLRVCQ